MVEENLIDLILHGSEERNLEYKSSLSWDDITTKLKVTKTAMSMANIKDGGLLIFGVDEIDSGQFEPNGMKKNDADSFNKDDVMDYVNGYADPYVDLKMEKIEYDGKLFIIIQIKEFDELPVVCKKSGQDLNEGNIYTRSRRKYESVPVSSQTEMREILEMAVDKRIRKLRKQLFQWGFIKQKSIEDIDFYKFKEQLGDL